MSNLKRMLIALACGLLVLLAATGRPSPAAEAVAPGNDDLASALEVAFQPYTNVQSTVDSGVEGGELLAYNNCQGDFTGPDTMGSTVWYKYTHTGAPTTLQLDTLGPGLLDTVIRVSTGPASSPTHGGLTQVACGDQEWGSFSAALTFAAAADQTYYIQVGGWQGGAGTFALNISPILSAAGGRYVVTSNADTGDATPDGLCTDGPGGTCTFREAIQESNALPGTDVISFETGGGGAVTITPSTPLPAMADVVIDARTENGFTSSPVVAVDGASQGCFFTYGLNPVGLPASIRGLGLVGWCQAGLLIQSDNNVVQGNYIGVGLNGTTAQPNGRGVYVLGTAGITEGNVIGGTTDAARNVISGNTESGVFIDGGSHPANSNRVHGNYIGTNAAGSAAVANGGDGVFINGSAPGSATNNMIGTSGPNLIPFYGRNVISGNATNGVVITGANATGNSVAGNYIGINAGGIAAIPNAARGVRLDSGANLNTIGGSAWWFRNTISGNGSDGVYLNGIGTTNNTIIGNHVGVGPSGISTIPNGGSGIAVDQAPGNTIGGLASGAPGLPPGNIVSGNVHGIVIFGDSADSSTVRGNIVGLNVNGDTDLGNADVGIWVLGGADNNTIGGTAAGERNVISGNNRGIGLFDFGTTGNVVRGNYVGTNLAGNADIANTNGIDIGYGASSNTIGGTAVGAGNLLSGNGNHGLGIGEGNPSNSNVVEGNYVGTTASGTGTLGNNGHGVVVYNGSSANVIGPGNVISSNVVHGIKLDAAGANTVKGNYIGTNAAGTAAVANGFDGVNIVSSTGNVIGGTVPADRNVISGNIGSGVSLDGGGPNSVTGNYIGLSGSGGAAVPNGGDGVLTTGAGDFIQSNFISGNGANGVRVNSAADTTVRGNAIGTNATASVLPNVLNGVLVEGTTSNVSIRDVNSVYYNGGSGIDVAPGSHANLDILGNLILFNGADGIRLSDVTQTVDIGDGTVFGRNVLSENAGNGLAIIGANSASHKVYGNYIGTGSSGTGDAGNDEHGILIWGAANQEIGGSIAGRRNVISGNNSFGIFILPQIAGVGANGNTILGNYIGTAADGVSPVGNAAGIQLFFAPSNYIGGVGAGEGNAIAFNGAHGVGMTQAESSMNIVRGNSIHSNGGLGIDLNADGLTANDAGDADAGPNGLQNFPVLTNAAVGGGNTVMTGSLNSVASTVFTIDYYYSYACDPGGYGEGGTFLATWLVPTDAGGNVNFLSALPAEAPAGSFITATATSPTGNTSEFANCIPAVDDGDDDNDGYTDVAEAGSPMCANNVNDDAFEDALVNDGCPAVGPAEVGGQCSNTTDDDADTFINDGCPQSMTYSEGQFNIGTKSNDPCGGDGWSSDIFGGGLSANKLTIQDVLSFVAPTRRLDTNPGNAGFGARWDLSPGRGIFSNIINIVDITTLVQGPASSPAFPPMFNGLRAFDKTCPFPP